MLPFDKYKGGYVVATLYSTHQVGLVAHSLAFATARHPRTGWWSPVEWRFYRAESYGVPCWYVVVPRKYMVVNARAAVTVALTRRFRAGDRFVTRAPLGRLLRSGGSERPVGTKGTIVDVCASNVYIHFDGEAEVAPVPGEERYYRTPFVGPWFIDPIDNDS